MRRVDIDEEAIPTWAGSFWIGNFIQIGWGMRRRKDHWYTGTQVINNFDCGITRGIGLGPFFLMYTVWSLDSMLRGGKHKLREVNANSKTKIDKYI